MDIVFVLNEYWFFLNWILYLLLLNNIFVIKYIFCLPKRHDKFLAKTAWPKTGLTPSCSWTVASRMWQFDCDCDSVTVQCDCDSVTVTVLTPSCPGMVASLRSSWLKLTQTVEVNPPKLPWPDRLSSSSSSSPENSESSDIFRIRSGHRKEEVQISGGVLKPVSVFAYTF